MGYVLDEDTLVALQSLINERHSCRETAADEV